MVFTVMLVFTVSVKASLKMKTNSEKIVTEVLQKVSALEVLTGTNNCDLIVKTENQTFYLQLLKLDSGYPGRIKKRIKEKYFLLDVIHLPSN